MAKLEIVAKEVTTSQTIKSIEIDPGQVNLGVSAKFPVKLFNADGGLIGIEFVEISGADYDDWGDDDTYVTNFVFTALGMSAE